MIKILRNLFISNWGLKLFSFLLAVILWVALIPEEKIFSEKTLTVLLEIYNIPPEMELVEKPRPIVDVRIRAPNRRLNEITSNNVKAVLDLRDADVGQQQYALNQDMITLPEGAEFKDIYPSHVELTMEMIEEILLEVQPVLTGKAAEGFKVEKVVPDPAQVPVRGPQSKLTDTYKVRTSPIDVSGLTESELFEVGLISPHPDLKLAFPDVKIKVRVHIQQINPEEKESEKDNKVS